VILMENGKKCEKSIDLEFGKEGGEGVDQIRGGAAVEEARFV
jgi:hypothetical protein